MPVIFGGNNLTFTRADAGKYAARPAPLRIKGKQATGLMVATPCYGASLPLGYMQSVFGLMNAIEELVILPGDSLVSRARNALAAIFLASPCSKLLMIDSDCVFQPRDAVRLDVAGLPMVGAVCPSKTADLSFAWNSLPGAETNSSTGILEIESCGMAFMLAAREVFETIATRIPGIRVNGPGYLSSSEQARHHAFFDTAIVNGWYQSEDIGFCRRWRECGGKIHVFPDMELRHIGSTEHLGALKQSI